MSDYIFKRALKYPAKFKRKFGTSIKSFRLLLSYLDSLIDRSKSKQGRKPIISDVTRLCCFLSYLKQYETMDSLSDKFEICTSSVWNVIQDLKFKLYNCDLIALKGTNEAKVISIDGTDTPVEKPGFDPISFYGRKKRYTIKLQVTVDGYSKEVLDIYAGEGSTHDFRLLRNSGLLNCISDDCGVIVDSGYVGIKNYHVKSVYPLKKPKNGILTESQKQFSTRVSKIRVLNEHVIGKLKFFKILAGRFRHCNYLVSSFECFAIIVAGIYNLNLNFG